MSWGVVLAGGGTKGSYHIGVWKALTELGLEIKAVTGTSIGAINGGILAQGDYEKAMELWKTISLNDIVKLPEEITGRDNLFDIRNVPAIAKEIYNQSGLDMSPLKNILDDIIDEKKLRNSDVDFGLVTYSVTSKSGVTLFIKDIPMGEVTEHMMASAAMPGFKHIKIGTESFADGAISDNMPVNMLIEKGYTDIICVDVKGIGRVKSFSETGRNIKIIEPKQSVVGTMDFDNKNIMTNMEMGYFDTLAEFGKYRGEYFYIESGSWAEAKMYYSEEIIGGIESAAAIFGLERMKAYTFGELFEETYIKYNDYVLEHQAEENESRNFPERFLKRKITDERLILLFVISILKNKRAEFFDNKIVKSILGDYSRAASSLIYFDKKNYEKYCNLPENIV